MNCQNLEHPLDAPTTAVALIRLPRGFDLETAGGYAVCDDHLLDYVHGMFLGQHDQYRVPFTVEPAP